LMVTQRALGLRAFGDTDAETVEAERDAEG
jgi:hypothetical protein